MQIRTRLTLQFLLLVGLIMIIASMAIYISSASFRMDDFYNRLRNKALSSAKLLLDAKTIDPSRVAAIEKDNPDRLQNERIIILNYLDDTLYTSDSEGEIIIRNDILQRVRQVSGIAYRQGKFEVLGILYTIKLDRFVVLAAATDNEGLLHLKKLKIILFTVCLISLLLSFAAGWFFAGRALKPIIDVIKNVEEVTITSLNLRINEGNGTDEIGRLAKTFNRMLARLEASFNMQKDFIANASHELRTPLTSINGQIEVLMMKDRSTGEYRYALESVLDDIKALIDLSNRLLLIARTSSENPFILNKKVRIDEILWQAQDELRRFNPNYRIGITMDEALTDSDQMIVYGDEYLLKVAVSNLMDNACKYSADNTAEVKITPGEKLIRIVFEDRGIGIPADEIQKVFQPFYRGSNALSFQGNGIGLQLVNQIIKNHNGKTELHSEVGKGTRVSVLLPVNPQGELL